MDKINISLCIPTMDRFDTFLKEYLKSYITYLETGVISEIIICDENGNDYEEIMKVYGDYIEKNSNFKVYKNDTILGVFKNKLKVASLSSFNYIALIDSDNFCDEIYFLKAKDYIFVNENSFSKSVILAPSFAKPNYTYKQFEGSIVTKQNIGHFFHDVTYQIILNTGNFIVSKNIIENIKYDESILYYITACDVLFFNLLAFQQIDDFQIHVVKDLEYTHVIHSGSICANTESNCADYIKNVIMPSYYELCNK